MFPGIKPKTVTVPANVIGLSRPLFDERPTHISPKNLEVQRLQQERIDRRKNEGNILLLPFRQLRHLFGKGLSALGAVFTNNPFIYLTADGYGGTWKLGKESGWALEDGRVLDRIVKSRVID